MLDSRPIELFIRQRLGKIQLRLSEEWGSKNEDHRLQLRQNLGWHLCDKTSLTFDTDKSSISTYADLARRPTHPNFSISISHCPSLGGFGMCPANYYIGLDIEESNRVTSSVAARVANQDEFHLAPPSHLWCAKEASFKALQQAFKIKVLSDITTRDWTFDRYQNVASFKAQVGTLAHHACGSGVIVELPTHVLAVFLISRLTLVEPFRRVL